MLVPITDRRRQIKDLHDNDDLEGLAKLGIVLKEGASSIDCGAYVLKKLGGYSSTQEAHSILWSEPRTPAPPHSGRCIVVYRFENTSQVLQHGLYQANGKILSKWGANEPVFLHEIQDVPADFGDLAEFIEITDDLRYKLQQTMENRQRGPDYY